MYDGTVNVSGEKLPDIMKVIAFIVVFLENKSLHLTLVLMQLSYHIFMKELLFSIGQLNILIMKVI